AWPPGEHPNAEHQYQQLGFSEFTAGSDTEVVEAIRVGANQDASSIMDTSNKIPRLSQRDVECLNLGFIFRKFNKPAIEIRFYAFFSGKFTDPSFGFVKRCIPLGIDH